MILYEWAQAWQIPYPALEDLQRRLGMIASQLITPPRKGESEGAVGAAIMMEAPQYGARLFRNNVGALPDERGVPVRYGLANTSPAINKVIKSGDYIGWVQRSVPELYFAGVQTVAQFASRETKKVGWHFVGDPHEMAQLAWADLVNAAGGDAKFTTGLGSFAK